MAKINLTGKRFKVSKKTKATTIPFKTKTSAKFVSFSFGATIPTGGFGNVKPTIEVTAASYEDARDFVIPKIEELYEKFCDVKPAYMGKITETVKVVVPPAAEVAATTKEEGDPSKDVAVDAAKPQSEAVRKAEKAISLAMTEDAVNVIQDQIEKSVKIDAADKPMLYTLCLKKKKELKK